jgi:predicted patatin/cPLA2 family phospholipase
MRSAFAAGSLAGLGEEWRSVAGFGNSAGAINLAFFYCNQMADLHRLYIHVVQHRRVVTPARIWRIIDADKLIEVIRDEMPLRIPRGGIPLEISLVRRDDGRSIYIDLRQLSESDVYGALRATTAVPILYGRSVRFAGVDYVDGGVAQPLLVRRAQQTHDYGLVITTRPLTSRRFDDPPIKGAIKRFLARGSGKHASQMIGRLDHEYNGIMAELQTHDASSKYLVCAPVDGPATRRTEVRRSRLEQLWSDGKAAAGELITRSAWSVEAHARKPSG